MIGRTGHGAGAIRATMTLTEFRYIVAVARERHFGRAAAACNVSQPTLSIAVRKIEEELGVTLFERGRSDVQVTPVGERVIAQARRVLAEAEQLRQVATRARDPLQAPLRLGAIYTIGPYLFPHLIPALRRHAPEMPLVIHEDFTAGLAKRLRAGELDAIVVALPFALAATSTLEIYEEPFRVVMPAGHRWAAEDAISPARLAEERVLLLGAGHCFRDQVVTACPDCVNTVLGDTGDGEPAQVESSSLETIRHMVASGLGITILPSTAVDGGGYGEGVLIDRPFTEPVPRRRVALAWRERFPRPEAIDALQRAIRDCVLPGVTFLRDGPHGVTAAS